MNVENIMSKHILKIRSVVLEAYKLSKPLKLETLREKSRICTVITVLC